MQISVKFFASLREQMGLDGKELELESAITVAEVWQRVATELPPENLLCSRNLKFAEWDEAVQDGDEVAFFPPVTGG